MEKNDKWEWLVRPQVRSAAGHIAGLAGYAAVAIAAMSLLDPLLWFCNAQELADVVGSTADSLFCIWIALLGVLVVWCHYVLLAERGFAATRGLCLLALIPSFFLLAASIYTAFAHKFFLYYQLDLPLYLSLVWLGACLLNLHTMAAAPLSLRIILPSGFFMLLLSGATIGIPEAMLPYTVVKTAACLLLFRPLLQLQRIAPRIISLPPLGDDTAPPPNDGADEESR